MSDTRAGLREVGGPATLTIWKDATWQVWPYRDAEIAYLCEPEKVLLTLDAATHEYVEFITPQQRVSMAEKLLAGRIDEGDNTMDTRTKTDAELLAMVDRINPDGADKPISGKDQVPEEDQGFAGGCWWGVIVGVASVLIGMFCVWYTIHLATGRA